MPFPSLGDLPHPGIEPMSLNISCIGKWILYHLGSPDERARTVIITIIATIASVTTIAFIITISEAGRNAIPCVARSLKKSQAHPYLDWRAGGMCA